MGMAVLLLMGDHHDVIYDPVKALARARRLISDFEGGPLPGASPRCERAGTGP
jgi:hypothetical protein